MSFDLPARYEYIVDDLSTVKALYEIDLFMKYLVYVATTDKSQYRNELPIGMCIINTHTHLFGKKSLGGSDKHNASKIRIAVREFRRANAVTTAPVSVDHDMSRPIADDVLNLHIEKVNKQGSVSAFGSGSQRFMKESKLNQRSIGAGSNVVADLTQSLSGVCSF